MKNVKRQGVVKVYHRRNTYRKYWDILVAAYREVCFYCDEHATVIDHIVPVAHGGSNELDNLLLSCAFCNLLASDKVFENEWHKREWLRKKREQQKKLTRAICTDCLLPFWYRVHSPSLLLCAECYDLEYETRWQYKKGWEDWLSLLLDAGYDAESHRLTAIL